MILLGLHCAERVSVQLTQGVNGYFGSITFSDDAHNDVDLFTKNFAEKADALQALMDLSDQLRVKCFALIDAENLADLRAAAAEQTLIAGGTEALP